MVTTDILSPKQRDTLRSALVKRLIAVCFGAGVDSIAMLVALYAAAIRPHVITFADTGGEKPETLAHVKQMNEVLARWGWPQVATCRKATLPSTDYDDLYGNCWANETLPSLAFGMKSCSIKWKTDCQDQYLKGAARGPNARLPHPLWERAEAAGERIVKLIGYDCGKADQRRSKNLRGGDADFDFVYPLQLIGWTRSDCVRAIERTLGAAMVPIKSACFFCPASKPWELWWLAAHHPDLLERSLRMEYRALTGRHSRFDVIEFGATWEQLVRTANRFPSSSTTVGLGRNFAWNQWAWANGIVDEELKVRRDPESVARFSLRAAALRVEDNALDARSQLAATEEERQVELFAD